MENAKNKQKKLLRVSSHACLGMQILCMSMEKAVQPLAKNRSATHFAAKPANKHFAAKPANKNMDMTDMTAHAKQSV